ncbi:hypothetical protein L596_014061 [Steinernema carpocapsae]|nr:hypothetical protein L596_014061 [Steinernema carpocapsae]
MSSNPSLKRVIGVEGIVLFLNLIKGEKVRHGITTKLVARLQQPYNKHFFRVLKRHFPDKQMTPQQV